MNYELAKKLREAGFPQRPNGGEFIDGDIESDETGIITTNSVYAPILEELIEACNPQKGDEMAIETYAGGWRAIYNYVGYIEHSEKFKDGDDMFDVSIKVEGSTPSEVVAHLWLALNEKTDAN